MDAVEDEQCEHAHYQGGVVIAYVKAMLLLHFLLCLQTSEMTRLEFNV